MRVAQLGQISVVTTDKDTTAMPAGMLTTPTGSMPATYPLELTSDFARAQYGSVYARSLMYYIWLLTKRQILVTRRTIGVVIFRVIIACFNSTVLGRDVAHFDLDIIPICDIFCRCYFLSTLPLPGHPKVRSHPIRTDPGRLRQFC